MEAYYDIEQLQESVRDMKLDQTRPCLFSGDFLDMLPPSRNYAVDRVDEGADKTTFDVRGVVGKQPKGIVFVDDDPNTPAYYEPVSVYIAGGITRVSSVDVDNSTNKLGGEVSLIASKKGLCHVTVHKTPAGPVISLDVNVEVMELVIPTIAINPFERDGWEYIQSIFETAAFCWIISDGRDAAAFFSASPWYADIASQTYRASLQSLDDVTERNFAAALEYMKN